MALATLAAPAAMAMALTSTDIHPNATIAMAQIYPRCGGDNISPQLSWSGAPAGTKSFVLTLIDLDVKPAQWSHWIVVDLPASATSLARGAKDLPAPAKAVVSNFGDPAYDGPCPPARSGVHHYQFTIWAMPTASFTIAPDAKASGLPALISKQALDKASLTGSVTR
jgi:hypothetical protein